jgi:hypothetical protein
MPGLAPNGADYGASFLTNSSGSLATFAAIRLASSRVSNFAAKTEYRGATMRLVACLTMGLMLIVANAAKTDAQTPSDPQAHCVNRTADFYPYTGEPCKSGYELGPGNCRKTDGRMVAVTRDQCLAMAGTVKLPFEGGRQRLRP